MAREAFTQANNKEARRFWIAPAFVQQPKNHGRCELGIGVPLASLGALVYQPNQPKEEPLPVLACQFVVRAGSREFCLVSAVAVGEPESAAVGS